MTTVGKGRGWGRNTEETTLRRPGQPPPGPRDELIERIRNINLSDLSSIKESSSPAAEIVCDRNNLINITKLYNEALEDRNFIKNLLVIFLNPSNKSSAFLTLLQPDYERRDNFWKDTPGKFLNYVCLMGEVFLRPNTFLPPPMIPHFALAIINLCKILLDSAGEDEIEVVMNQLWLNGEKLNIAQPKELSDLINHIRGVLITKNLSTRSRGLLLFSIELANNNYSVVINPDLQKFYESHLTKKTFDDLVNQKNAAMKFEPQAKAVDVKNVELQSPPRYNHPKSSKTLEKPEERDSPPRPQQNHPPRPRAIRGSGVNGTSRDDEKKISKKSPPHWNDGKKGWGHDDRWERDY